MEVRYLKLENSKFYVKIIDAQNNIHIRETAVGWAIDMNGSPNESYEDMKGCSRQEFDAVFIKIVTELNQISKL